MRIILGIGNPGNKYTFTRHNAGFLLLDYFAEKHSLSFKASKKEYYYSDGKTGDAGFSLIKPTTYVNNSGIAALDALEIYKTSIDDLLVIADDVNIPTGEIRLRANGGDGGHNGLKSIIYHLNSNSFARLRIGVGEEIKPGELVSFVLSPFSKDDFIKLKTTFDKSSVLIEEFIKGGLKGMMDANAKLPKDNPPILP